MVDRRERFEDPEETMRVAIEGHLGKLWTAMPAIIQSVNLAKGTVVAQPAISRRSTLDDKEVPISVIADVPILWPGGGGATMTFPIAAGDECLLIFASRSIDGWFQSGGVQAAPWDRRHDLSDAFALVGVRSGPRALSGVSGSAVELRADAGGSKVSLNPETGALTILAPGGVTIVAEAGVTIQGDVTVDGEVTANGIPLSTHKHENTQPGLGVSGEPIP